ncbi:hypothetical protein AWC38_SpisGene2939, partial [Stylophora pistillata]
MSNGEHGLKRAEKDNEGRDQHREFFHRRRGHQGEYLLEDEYDEEFWIKVHEKQNRGLSWNRAMDEVRVERLIQTFKGSGEKDSEDPALLILKQWPASEQYIDSPEKLAGLEQMINRFLDILLESELSQGNRYKAFRDESDKSRKTLLHYAAELGFLHVSKTLVKKCPLLLTMTTEAQVIPVKKRAMLPLELAIVAQKDDVAEFLIRAMRHERVQSLFIWKPDEITSPEASFFSFKAVIGNPKMKKTVVAVLDQMMNPHWPYLPKRQENYETEEEREAIEGVWNTISDDPLIYHFYYHILDGDEGGRPPKIMSSDGHKLIENKYFNWKEKSCLHAIAMSNNKDALQHPVVRMLIKTKWKSYGHLFLRLQAAVYCFFLLFMSYSLLHASTKLDPTHYSGALDSLRGFCEVATLLMVIFYICEEINQTRIGFGDVLLSGFQALSDQYPMAEDYSTFNDPGMWKVEKVMEGAEKGNKLGNQHEIDCCRDQQRGNLSDEEFDKEFWIKVHQRQKKRLSWNRALGEVHVERMIQKYKDSGELDHEDPALVMLKQWPASKQYQDNPDKLQGLEQKINQLLEILLESELNSKKRYEKFRDTRVKAEKTLMHYAAELGFLHVTKTLVKKCPLLLAMTTEAQRKPFQKRAMLPVELAIEAEKDDVAAYLIRVMWYKRVQSLFSWTPDDMINPKPSSCSFKAVIQNPKMKEALQHPVVRMLIKTKWRSYGHLFLSLQAAFLCIFLLCMSFSLLHASIRLDSTRYSGVLDSLRGLCEVVTLLMVGFYVCEEINQIRMTTGLYTKTLAKIILHDVTRSMAVFVVIFFSFCGALTLSLCYSGFRENQELRGFGNVLLSGFQALSDQYPMVEDYSTFNWLSVLLMMAYMGTVTVILLNILVAQMSTTYTQAKKVARLEYDVDRILQLTRMERFPFLNLRVKYYKEGDWISEMNLAKELLEFSEDRNPWESVEEKLSAI